MVSQSSFVFNLLSSKKIHGIICWSSQLCNKDGFFFDIEGFLEQNPHMPAVFIGKPVKNYPTLMIDNYPGIYQIMNHLIHVHNYRKIAFISGPEVHPYARERYEAYVKILKENNIDFNPRLVSPHAHFQYEFGAKAISYFLDEQKLRPKKDIEAIISVSDMFSYTAIEELKKRKIRVPKDVAVVGFNNRYDSISINPTITTIDAHFEGIGKQSIEILISLLNGKKNPG